MNERSSAIDLADKCLSDAMDEYEPLKEWRVLMNKETFHTNAWMIREVDLPCFDYETNEMQIGFFIAGKYGSSRVLLKFPRRTWQTGIERIAITIGFDRAMKLCDFMWNENLLAEENAVYPRAEITIEL